MATLKQTGVMCLETARGAMRPKSPNTPSGPAALQGETRVSKRSESYTEGRQVRSLGTWSPK
eukprot:6220338-Pyramimonas_sp.AAC.1